MNWIELMEMLYAGMIRTAKEPELRSLPEDEQKEFWSEFYSKYPKLKKNRAD